MDFTLSFDEDEGSRASIEEGVASSDASPTKSTAQPVTLGVGATGEKSTSGENETSQAVDTKVSRKHSHVSASKKRVIRDSDSESDEDQPQAAVLKDVTVQRSRPSTPHSTTMIATTTSLSHEVVAPGEVKSIDTPPEAPPITSTSFGEAALPATVLPQEGRTMPAYAYQRRISPEDLSKSTSGLAAKEDTQAVNLSTGHPSEATTKSQKDDETSNNKGRIIVQALHLSTTKSQNDDKTSNNKGRVVADVPDNSYDIDAEINAYLDDKDLAESMKALSTGPSKNAVTNGMSKYTIPEDWSIPSSPNGVSAHARNSNPESGPPELNLEFVSGSRDLFNLDVGSAVLDEQGDEDSDDGDVEENSVKRFVTEVPCRSKDDVLCIFFDADCFIGGARTFRDIELKSPNVVGSDGVKRKCQSPDKLVRLLYIMLFVAFNNKLALQDVIIRMMAMMAMRNKNKAKAFAAAMKERLNPKKTPKKAKKAKKAKKPKKPKRKANSSKATTRVINDDEESEFDGPNKEGSISKNVKAGGSVGVRSGATDCESEEDESEDEESEDEEVEEVVEDPKPTFDFDIEDIPPYSPFVENRATGCTYGKIRVFVEVVKDDSNIVVLGYRVHFVNIAPDELCLSQGIQGFFLHLKALLAQKDKKPGFDLQQQTFAEYVAYIDLGLNAYTDNHFWNTTYQNQAYDRGLVDTGSPARASAVFSFDSSCVWIKRAARIRGVSARLRCSVDRYFPDECQERMTGGFFENLFARGNNGGGTGGGGNGSIRIRNKLRFCFSDDDTSSERAGAGAYEIHHRETNPDYFFKMNILEENGIKTEPDHVAILEGENVKVPRNARLLEGKAYSAKMQNTPGIDFWEDFAFRHDGIKLIQGVLYGDESCAAHRCYYDWIHDSLSKAAENSETFSFVRPHEKLVDPALTFLANALALDLFDLEEVCVVLHVHEELQFLQITSLLSCDTRDPTLRMHVLYLGPPTAGKSFIQDEHERCMVPGTVDRVSTMSKNAQTVDVVLNGRQIMFDEAPDNFYEKGESGAGSNQLKEALSRGQVANIMAAVEGPPARRVEIKTISERQSQHIINANSEVDRMHPSVVSRLAIRYVTVLDRPERQVIIEMERAYSDPKLVKRSAAYREKWHIRMTVACILMIYLKLGWIHPIDTSVPQRLFSHVIEILKERGYAVELRDGMRFFMHVRAVCIMEAIERVFFTETYFKAGTPFAWVQILFCIPYLVCTTEHFVVALGQYFCCLVNPYVEDVLVAVQSAMRAQQGNGTRTPANANRVGRSHAGNSNSGSGHGRPAQYVAPSAGGNNESRGGANAGGGRESVIGGENSNDDHGYVDLGSMYETSEDSGYYLLNVRKHAPSNGAEVRHFVINEIREHAIRSGVVLSNEVISDVITWLQVRRFGVVEQETPDTDALVVEMARLALQGDFPGEDEFDEPDNFGAAKKVYHDQIRFTHTSWKCGLEVNKAFFDSFVANRRAHTSDWSSLLRLCLMRCGVVAEPGISNPDATGTYVDQGWGLHGMVIGATLMHEDKKDRVPYCYMVAGEYRNPTRDSVRLSELPDPVSDSNDDYDGSRSRLLNKLMYNDDDDADNDKVNDDDENGSARKGRETAVKLMEDWRSREEMNTLDYRARLRWLTKIRWTKKVHGIQTPTTCLIEFLKNTAKLPKAQAKVWAQGVVASDFKSFADLLNPKTNAGKMWERIAGEHPECRTVNPDHPLGAIYMFRGGSYPYKCADDIRRLYGEKGLKPIYKRDAKGVVYDYDLPSKNVTEDVTAHGPQIREQKAKQKSANNRSEKRSHYFESSPSSSRSSNVQSSSRLNKSRHPSRPSRSTDDEDDEEDEDGVLDGDHAYDSMSLDDSREDDDGMSVNKPSSKKKKTKSKSIKRVSKSEQPRRPNNEFEFDF